MHRPPLRQPRPPPPFRTGQQHNRMGMQPPQQPTNTKAMRGEHGQRPCQTHLQPPLPPQKVGRSRKSNPPLGVVERPPTEHTFRLARTRCHDEATEKDLRTAIEVGRVIRRARSAVRLRQHLRLFSQLRR